MIRRLRNAPGAPVTETARALRTAVERYRLAARATDDIVWDYDLETGVVHWNEALTRRFGHAPDDLVTPIEWWETRVHADDRGRVVASIRAAIDGVGDYWSEEYRFQRTDGCYADVLDRGYLIRDEAGRGLRMVGAMLDFSARRAIERRAQESEERLRLAQEAAGLGSFDYDLDSGRLEISGEFRRLHGLDEDEPVTVARLAELTHPDDRGVALAGLMEPATAVDGRQEFRIRRCADAEWRWLASTARTLRDDNGRPVRRIGVVEDITDRKLAEARLRESEENYRFTVELSPQLVWTADADGSNIEFKRPLSGFLDPPEDKHDRWNDWNTHPDDIAYKRREWEFAMRSGRPYDAQFRVLNRDGEYRWVRSRGYPRRDAKGRIVKWYGVTEDIHAQRSAEQQLQRLQTELSLVARVSAMGTLASTLAHELNQPLTAVANYMAGSKRLLANHGADALPVIGEAIDQAAKAAIQAGEIVRRLRELVARGEVNTQRVDLAALVQEACDLTLGERRDRAVELSLELGPDTRTVFADRIQLQQVLVNLLRNAAEAMTDSPRRLITLSAIPTRGDQVTVRVEDTGPGVSPDVKRHLFSPFVTTKESGMGVGLSICRSIIEAHGGQLWVEDAPGGGAVFCFTLTRASDRR